MARFIIRGGRRISGRHRALGNKNAALPMLVASLLTDEPVTLTNLPRIKDVHTTLEMLSELGVTVSLRGHTVTLQANRVRKRRVSAELCSRVRSAILLSGPMAARFGWVQLHPPGGDLIGRRPIDTHIRALEALGIKVDDRGAYRFECKKLRGADILLEEASVTATENVVMAAVLAEGRTTIFNAACEPHVQDLCNMLNSMGAQITGIGTNLIAVEGVTTLGGGRFEVPADHIESASFMAAATLTGGALTVERAPISQFEIISRPLEKIGVNWSARDGELHVPASQSLKVRNDYGAAIPRIEDGTWPGFPSDLMSVALVMATQAEGTVLFFEKMFESRLYFVDRLISMGARIVQCDPHRVIVSGPAPLRGTHLASPDIRAGMALVLAALCAKGESVIGNIEAIDRGYENIDKKLRALGADIERKND
ncbi:MAG: UDP-N-acetylglucosamine 1-carboxyvinyltransferase [Candidatus Promineifilaceae bacterium]|jgi:UDP-N-acetylglucosamine 1-carboxyvinyltransferase